MEDLNSFYKRARNKLRHLEPESYLLHTASVLHEAHAGGIEVLGRYQPWNILLAAKWLFEEMDPIAHARPKTHRNDLHGVLNILHEMEGAIVPSSFSETSLFMRRLAFQQFWLQSPDIAALARQEILFGALPEKHRFSVEFKSATGLQISDYVVLALVVMVALIKHGNAKVIDGSIFRPVQHRFTKDALDHFMGSLSRTPEEWHKKLRDPQAKKQSIADQLVLPSPLKRAPLLRMGQKYVVLFPPLVHRALEACIYTVLREPNPDRFMEIFGEMFERYVERCLHEAHIPYTTQSELLAILPPGGNVVDFVIEDPDLRILIEVKGVEPSPKARISYRASRVVSALKTPLDGVAQAMKTARRLDASAHFGSKPETFLIVVTYEQLYLGCSSDLANVLGPSFTDDLTRSVGTTLPFPLENVFFLSIRDFERLLEIVRAGRTTIAKALRHAKTADSVHSTRKFVFGMHLSDLGADVPLLPMLKQSLEAIASRSGKS